MVVGQFAKFKQGDVLALRRLEGNTVPSVYMCRSAMISNNRWFHKPTLQLLPKLRIRRLLRVFNDGKHPVSGAADSLRKAQEA